MELGLRSRLVFLHLWCGVLSVAVIVMATMFITTTTTTTTKNDQQKQTQEQISTGKVKTSPTVPPMSTLQTTTPSLSYIQIIPTGPSWTLDSDLSEDLACVACSLVYENSSIHCSREGLYLVYAQVLFRNSTEQNHNFTLWKKQVPGKTRARSLFQIKVPQSQKSVFVMKVVSLLEGDSISMEINGKFFDHETFWGMIQLQHIGGEGHN